MTIKHIFVVGTMGNGIAQVVATSGYDNRMDVMPALKKPGDDCQIHCNGGNAHPGTKGPG
jgi:hypothetical protein